MKSAQVGGFSFGEGAFFDIFDFPNVTQINPSPGHMRTQLGWGHPTQRQYTRAFQWALRPTNSVPGTSVDIDITSNSGALLGKIRSDIQHPTILSLQFTDDVNGSADFTLKLSKLPEFDILPMSFLTFKIADSSFNWYKGIVTQPDKNATKQNQTYEFKGFGLRSYLDTLEAFTTYAATLDITEAVVDLITNWIVPYCPIKYNPAKIFGLSGVVLAETIELGKFPIGKILNTFSDMAGFDWSVDGNGEFNWFPKVTQVVKTFFVGYNVNDFVPTDNYDKIKNEIFLQRQQGLGSGGSGWAAAGIFDDASSIKKYGQRTETVQIPGFFSDTDAANVGNAHLAALKDPQTTAQLNSLEIKGENEFIENGLYRIVMPQDQYTKTEQDVDDRNQWVKTGAGDLALFDDETFFVYANGGVRFEFTHALNDRVVVPLAAKGVIKKIEFYLRSTFKGNFITVGVGKTNWDENIFKPDIAIIRNFFRVSWDVSALDLQNIRFFGVRIDEDFSALHELWIDKIDFVYSGNEIYKLKKNRAIYNFDSKGAIVNIEFGPIPSRMDEYVTGLKSAVDELKFTQEVR